ACNSCSVAHLVPAPQLSITKSASASPATVGVPFDYTITVTNEGTGNATADAVVTDAIPAGLTINSCTPACSASGQTVTWVVSQAALVADGSVILTVNVTPTAAAIPGVTNTSTV